MNFYAFELNYWMHNSWFAGRIIISASIRWNDAEKLKMEFVNVLKKYLLAIFIVHSVVSSSVVLASSSDPSIDEMASQCEVFEGANKEGVLKYSENTRKIMQSISLRLVNDYRPEDRDKEEVKRMDREVASLVETLHRPEYQNFILAEIKRNDSEMQDALRYMGNVPQNDFKMYFECVLFRALYEKNSKANLQLIAFLKEVHTNADLKKMGQEKGNGSSSVPAAESSVQVGYFKVKVNSCRVGSKVGTENPLAEPKKWPDSKFLVIDASFKNTDTEGRLPLAGSALIEYGGKTYKFDAVESVYEEGFGIGIQSVNPLVTLRTKLVYRIPSEIKGRVSWLPGRNAGGVSLPCGTI